MNKIVLGLLLAMGIQSQSAEFLVKYKDQRGLMSLQNRLQQKNSNVQMLDQHDKGSYLVVDIRQENEKSELEALQALPGVEYVVPNFELKSFSEIPARYSRDSKNLKEQWAMAKVQAERAWQRAGNQGSRNITVAVIDTGVDDEHQALAPNMMAGFDFADNDDDANDITSRSNPGHGTHCAGVIGATGRIPGGIVGLSPDVRMMPIRFLNEKGSGDLNNGIKAIDFAIEKGAQIISASWGAQVPESTAKPLMEAVKRAADAGVLFVVAAGNSNKNNDKVGFYPANAPYDNVINVAASNKRDGKPSFSNFGRGRVHVSSPGEGIMSTLPGDKYGNLSGTSMATPLVAGLAALLMAQDSKLTAPQ
ncbi:MAG: S8 family peptidase, partial [Bdellovibrionales bacterium]